MKIILRLLAALVLLSAFGCASVMKGTSQNITITSNPEAAQVLLDGEVKGITPLTLNLPKGKNHSITVKKEGYNSQTMPMDKRFDPVAIINVFWDLSTTDLITGAVYEYEPNSYYFDLAKQGN